ncbi:MAG: hypothetical protein WCS77_02780 [Elusimicrobiaceae bacterium]
MKKVILALAVVFGVYSAAVYAQDYSSAKPDAVPEAGSPAMDDEDFPAPPPADDDDGIAPGRRHGGGPDMDKRGPGKGRDGKKMKGMGAPGGMKAMHGGMGSMMGGGMGGNMPFMEEMEKKVLKAVEKQDKAFSGELKALKEDNHMLYMKIMPKLGHLVFMGKMTEDKDAVGLGIDMAKNTIQEEDLVKQYGQAKGGDKDAIRKKLSDSISAQFDLKVKLDEKRIKEVEKQLAELKDKAKVRKENKKTIVSDRVAELLGEKMKW